VNVRHLSITVRGHKLLIDVGYERSLGIYGEEFWSGVGNNTYEPPTFDFIDSVMTDGYQDFIDVGAATGCMSLYAASIGLNVLAIEPQSRVFQALERNLSLNQHASKLIRSEFALVVGSKDAESVRSSFTPGASGPLDKDGLSEKTISFKDIAEFLPINSRTAIKIDIEGAEFPLFCNHETLELLSKKQPLIYLALHPGFRVPLPTHARLPLRIVWRCRAAKDILHFYRSIRNLATIRNAQSRKKIGLLGLFMGLKRDEKDYLIQF
jgi:FkbM family methyltransferase